MQVSSNRVGTKTTDYVLEGELVLRPEEEQDTSMPFFIMHRKVRVADPDQAKLKPDPIKSSGSEPKIAITFENLRVNLYLKLKPKQTFDKFKEKNFLPVLQRLSDFVRLLV